MCIAIYIIMWDIAIYTIRLYMNHYYIIMWDIAIYTVLLGGI